MASSSRLIPMIDSTSSSSSSSLSNESSSDGDEETISLRYEKRMQKMTHLLPPQMLTMLSQPIEKRYINRDREGANQQIWRDYFAENCTYPLDYFHRRFRMRRELFLLILKDVEGCEEYFVQKSDACGRLGCSSIQKVTAAIRILAYGLAANHCDEYLKIGESTAIESLKVFCKTIISLYEKQYLRSPNEQDIARLLQEGAERGFLGSHNDLNVLNHSPIFDNFIHGKMPPVNYEVNGHQHTLGYYLTDGIYPKWATLIQTIPHPITGKEKLFASKQEAVRKDVERAFGVLQIRWGITQGPVRYWKKDELCIIMKTCIIRHNMIIENERDTDAETWRPPLDENISPPEYTRNSELLVAYISARTDRVENRETNTMLRQDLMEHLWNRFGDQVV